MKSPPKPGRELTAEEKRLWKEVRKSAVPLRREREETQDAPEPVSVPPRPRPLRAPAPPSGKKNAKPAKALASGDFDGIDRRTAQRFRKGELAIEATLDLHGMTREKAHAEFVHFVRRAYARRQRMLLVITGKGRGGAVGVLRAALPEWVEASLPGEVLALHPASAAHGGGGAYYLLLRRQRGEKA